jgi:hypothetical protein
LGPITCDIKALPVSYVAPTPTPTKRGYTEGHSGTERLSDTLIKFRINFSLELDRGTMDIKSRQLVGKSSFRRKLIGYYQLWQEGLHASRWGFKAFRVLTVTPSEKRIENMLAAQREIVGEQGSNLFLFTTPKALREKSPLADVWVTGKGAVTGLLP